MSETTDITSNKPSLVPLANGKKKRKKKTRALFKKIMQTALKGSGVNSSTYSPVPTEATGVFKKIDKI